MKNNIAIKDETKRNGNVVPYQQAPLFQSFQEEMNHLFDTFRQNLSLGFAPATKWLEPVSDFNAKMDVKDTDKEVIVTAELPGVEMKDIELSLNLNNLTIKGEKRAEKEDKENGYYRMERSYGSFYRQVPLPCEIDRDKIAANFKDGVIKIVLPKTKAAHKSEQKINIKAE